MEDEVYENEVIPPLGNDPGPAGGEPPEEPQEAGAEPADTTEEPEPEEPTADDTAADTEEKKNKGVQKRIDELTRQKHEAAREAEYWKSKALQGQQQPEQPESVQPQGKPTVDQFETYEDFVEALTDWKTDQKLAIRESVAAQNAVVETHATRVDAARTDYPDFDEVVSSANDITFSDAMLQAMIGSDKSADLMYYLAKNKEELQSISQMSVVNQVKALGRIEATLEKKPEPKPTPVKRVTQAPEPIKPVGGKEKATINADDMSDAEWLEHERKRLAKMGRLY